MSGNRVSDFSIERILSPQLGLKPTMRDFSPDPFLQGMTGQESSGNIRSPPVSIPVQYPGPGCIQYRGVHCGDAFYPHGAAYHPADFSSFYPNSTVQFHFSSQDPADAQQFLPGYHGHHGYHGYHQNGVSALSQSRQKTRMRTVFTNSQTKTLEALHEHTDYPAVDARAEVARRTGLSEETVRVWFKNRRARRRRRQRSGSKVESSSLGKENTRCLSNSSLPNGSSD
ncbi:Homeobox protein goosecoid isoform B [Dissostichus eleginoides]|uniref:Homeobox protein goosecoid isoform B n=1 Tax=Dissostichus eleginoides TaxID=100907 RepID=A0AAD9CFS7_DISEL|nr:Homeobox protein goosecoid isoform B [Dissostichus eleginoides]